MSNAVRNDVKALVIKELAAANEKFPPFYSAHEGYAIMLEEVEEADEEMSSLKGSIKALWDFGVKHNSKYEIKTLACAMYECAEKLACEAIQVAAMAEKMLVFLDKQEG